MNFFGPRIYNRILRRRLSGRKLGPLARKNLEALDHLRLNEPARTHRFVVVDLETTGLNKKKDRVVSVGAFRIVDGRIRLGEVFSELVNPGRSIPPESIRVHAITPDAIRTARPAWEVFQDFLTFLGNDILVAHHAQFDLHFIDWVMREQYGFRIQNLVLDTILMCRHALPDPDFLGVNREAHRCSLDNLSELFELKTPERHTALGDAMLTALIFQRLILMLEQAGHVTLRSLVKLAGVWRV